MALLTRITAAVLAAACFSCAPKFFAPSDACRIAAVKAEKSGSGGIAVRFEDNGRCFYEGRSGDSSSYVITVLSGSFDGAEIYADEFTRKLVSSFEAENDSLKLTFARQAVLAERKEGGRTIFTIRPDAERVSGLAPASFLLKVTCSAPGFFEAEADGAMRFAYGSVAPGLFFVDVFDARPADNFRVPSKCADFLDVAKVSYPDRIRFRFRANNGERAEICSRKNKIAAVKGSCESESYIFKIEDSRVSSVQTVKVYLSGDTAFSSARGEGDALRVTLSKPAKLLSGVARENALAGPAFYSLAIRTGENGAEEMIFKSGNADIKAYAEKTDYGFVVRAEKLR